MQNHIFDILTRIRYSEFLYSSDITKMYRQILLKPEDQIRLRILWRKRPEEPVKKYFLKTVTYELDCALWQTIRTLHQVADDIAPEEGIRWIVNGTFYMDDLFYEAHSVNEAQDTIRKITETSICVN